MGGGRGHAGPRQLLQRGLRRDEHLQIRVRYTEENPSVRNKVAEIEALKAARPDLFEVPPAGEEGAVGATGLKGDIARLEQEVRSREEERAGVHGEIATYTARINKTPIREQELKSLSRDYNILKKEYENLLHKKEIATRGEDLEATQRGDHFRIQDPAVAPTRPFRPVFMQIFMLCIVVGLGAGVGAAALLEFLDQTFKGEDDFRSAFPDIPVLVSIPTIDGGGRTKHKGRGRSAAVWLLAGVLSTAALSAAYTSDHLRSRLGAKYIYGHGSTGIAGLLPGQPLAADARSGV